MENNRQLCMDELLNDISVEEQIHLATRELEERNNDLIQKLYYKEQEVAQLRRALENQSTYFEKTVSNLVQALCGPDKQNNI